LTFFFVFFTKTTPFWFFFKIRMDRRIRWLDQNPETGPWTGPGLKTMSSMDDYFEEYHFLLIKTIKLKFYKI
jgi:hypothetical protein